ncbi:SusC/RagA family TonB-linked outer membrane protein [Flavobacterium sp. LMO8]|uniref:SusC/RagA family TonB-linked outer membrane protein n=1 Tax=Flavobacterium sp. LMO8 TaxID=2654244 RepID=UPI001292811C|nr:TonB-dependent receptor [Flavobacterium sp. LMO8]MQP25654.1 SusC/RagA family TonB-linked outer membrane protein [Flavobacterium sp. LMO8]
MKNLISLMFFFVVLSENLYAQEITIKGTIVDETNQPLSGASVAIKNTSKGVIADFDGNFIISVPSKDNILVFSFLGYQNQEITVGNQKEIKVSLQPDVEQLKDVIVIGYGEVKKEDITGAITSIKPSDVTKNQSQGIENILQGRAAGVVVSQNGFEPTSPISIQIRGVNSLGMGTQPLYVVDGIIVNSAGEDNVDPLEGGNTYLATQNGLVGISPKDIESIEILKDASATAIYGSRGSNGVIIVTTKQGKEGKTVFSYNGSTRIGEIVRDIDVLDGYEYANYNNQSRILKGFTTNYIVDDATKVVTDLTGNVLTPKNWSDEIYKTSYSQSHRFSASGGKNGDKFYYAIGHVENQGIIPRSFSKVTDLNVTNSKHLTTKLTLDSKATISLIKNSASKGTEFLGGSDNNMVRQIIGAVPFENAIDNAISGVDPEDAIDGPLAWIKDYDDLAEEIRGLGSLKLEYKINDVFKYRVLGGVDFRKKERKIWYGTSLFRGAQVNGEAGISDLERFRYNVDNTLMFNKKFNKNHRINGTVGVVFEELMLKSKAVTASDFPIKDLRADGIRNAQVISPYRYNESQESIASFIGRVNYTLANKYNFTATFRADGSSKFDPDNRWGYFPSLAFAWQINREKFLENFSKLNEMKLRLGWGTTGNQNTPAYQYLSSYSANPNPYPGNNGGEIAMVPINVANRLLTWETTYQTNAGLDLGFFNKRLTTSIDFYHKRTEDLLQRMPLAPSDGYDFILANVGTLENKGFEVNLNLDVIKNDNLKWSIYANYSMYRTKIVKLGLSPSEWGDQTLIAFQGNEISGGNYFKTFANIYAQGLPAGSFFGYETNGIINTPDELALAGTINGIAPQFGDVLVIDQDGDGLITDRDKTVIGDPNPDFTYGFGSTLEYKNFSLSLAFNGVYGNEIANGNLAREAYADGTTQNIRSSAFYNAWDATTNPNGSEPRINYDLNDDLGFTDRMLEDGSFLRLQYVSLGYSIPLSKKSIFSSADISVAGNNLLLFTNYSGYDPEVNSFSSDPLRTGIDWMSFPNQRSYSINLNLTF